MMLCIRLETVRIITLTEVMADGEADSDQENYHRKNLLLDAYYQNNRKETLPILR